MWNLTGSFHWCFLSLNEVGFYFDRLHIDNQSPPGASLSCASATPRGQLDTLLPRDVPTIPQPGVENKDK